MLTSVYLHVVTQPAEPTDAAQHAHLPSKKERLIELQQLLNDKLITPDEATAARMRILTRMTSF